MSEIYWFRGVFGKSGIRKRLHVINTPHRKGSSRIGHLFLADSMRAREEELNSH
jgi:hypothetical protein